jgi:hypothetical protein
MGLSVGVTGQGPKIATKGMFFKPAAPSLQNYNGTKQGAIFQGPNRLGLYLVFMLKRLFVY